MTTQRDRLRDIRARLITEMEDAVDEMVPALRDRTLKLIADIRKLYDLPEAKYKRRVRTLINTFHRQSDTELARIVGEQVSDIAQHVNRYDGGVLTEARAIYTGETAAAGVRAALAHQARELAKPEVVQAVTQADAKAMALKRPPPGQTIGARIRKETLRNSREARRVVLSAIREGKTVTEGSRELAKVWRKAGAPEDTTRVIDRLDKAGKSLARRTGDPDAIFEWKKKIEQVRSHAGKLKKGLAARKSYFELLARLEAGGPEQLDQVVDRWTYGKQLSRGETWVRTEKAAAFRAEQFDRDSDRSYITHYISRLNRGRSRLSRRRKRAMSARSIRKSAKRGRRKGAARTCICCEMDGKKLSAKVVQSRLDYGWHPNCNCTFEPVYDMDMLVDAPQTTTVAGRGLGL